MITLPTLNVDIKMAISFLQGEFLRVIVPSNEYYYDDHCVGGRSPNWTVRISAHPILKMLTSIFVDLSSTKIFLV